MSEKRSSKTTSSLWKLKTRIIANIILSNDFNISTDFPLAKGFKKVVLTPEFIFENTQTGAFDVEITFEVEVQNEGKSSPDLVITVGRETLDRFLDLLSFISCDKVEIDDTVTFSTSLDRNHKRYVIPGQLILDRNPSILEKLNISNKQIKDKLCKSLRWFRYSLDRSTPVDRFHSIAVAVEVISNEFIDKLCEPEPKSCDKCGHVYSKNPSTRSKFVQFIKHFGKISEKIAKEVWKARTIIKHGGETSIYYSPPKIESYFWYCKIAFIYGTKHLLNLDNQDLPIETLPSPITSNPELDLVVEKDTSSNVMSPEHIAEELMSKHDLHGYLLETCNVSNDNLTVVLNKNDSKLYIKFIDYTDFNIDWREFITENRDPIIHHWRLVRKSKLTLPKILNDFGFSDKSGLHIGIFANEQSRSRVWMEITCKDIQINEI